MSYLERRQKEGEEETGPTAFYVRSERSSHRPLPRKIVRASRFTPLKFSKHLSCKRKLVYSRQPHCQKATAFCLHLEKTLKTCRGVYFTSCRFTILSHIHKMAAKILKVSYFIFSLFFVMKNCIVLIVQFLSRNDIQHKICPLQ